MKKPMMFFGPLMGGGGGGGSADIPDPNPDQELKQINRFQDKNIQRFNSWQATNPLISTATTGALDFFSKLPSLTNPLAKLQSTLPSFYSGLQNELDGVSSSLKSLIPGLRESGNIFGRNVKGFQSVIDARGYDKETERNAAQMARSASSAAGALHTSGAIGQEVLGRQDARDRRLALYSGLQSQAGQSQAGSTGAAGGILGLLNSAIQGRGALKSGEASTTSGLSSSQSNLQTNSLNQLLGVGSSAVSQWGGLTNPGLQYVSNLFGRKMQGDIASADIAAKADAASAGGAKEGIGQVLELVGPIIGAVAMSDERTKTNIKDTGMKTPEGIALKSWEYKFRPGVRYLGHTAQDVEEKVPGAVFTEPYSGRGIKLIDRQRFPAIEIESEVA